MNAIFMAPRPIVITIPNDMHRPFPEQSGGLIVGVIAK